MLNGRRAAAGRPDEIKKKIHLIWFKNLFYLFWALLTALWPPKTLFGPVLSIFDTFFHPPGS